VGLVLIGAVIAGEMGLGQGVALHPRGGYYFGTLVTDPSKARLEHGKGVRVAYLGLRWSDYEPTEGVYNVRYVARVKAVLRKLRRAGSLVEVGVGLNHPPAWLFQHHPDAAYVDQYGRRYTTTANIVFSRAARRAAQKYILRVKHDIGLRGFWAIRVGVDSNGEFMYPSADADRHHANSYWAFDVNAQAPTPDRGRARMVPVNPFPGWRPGDRTYRGQVFTVGDVRRWYDWYLAALAAAVNWQIRDYRALGYKGYLDVLIPGAGYYPSTYLNATAAYLDGATVPKLTASGAGFFKTIPAIKKRAKVVIVSTSLVDGSGTPPNNGCAPSDSKVDILARSPRPEIYDWSSVRWISDIARHSGFSLLSGESAGPEVAPYYPGVMRVAAKQMATCGLQGLMWAFDLNLYDGTPGSSLQDYAAVIRQYNRP
jgi:hypothetical protein